jgi:flavin reductase (DIM6/NTAB) family NADH-FMN oxidoreductase RutF
MTLRSRASLLLVLLGLPLALVLAGCNKVESLSIVPGPGIEVLTAAGQTAQYTAFAEERMGSGPQSTSNVTNSVSWSSSNPNVATINSSGLATAVGAGYVEITATSSNNVIATSDLTVNIAGTTTGGTGSSIVSISVIPGSQTVSSPSQTSQFLAIGTTSSGATVDLTNQVAWSSSSAQIGTVNASGLATAVGQGTDTITVLYTNPVGGSVVTGTATFTVSGGTTEKYTAVGITPGSQALSASGQTGQFVALGTSGATGLKTDVTNSPQIKWSSSIPSIASVSATGLASGLSTGTTTITAELTNADGTVVSNTATVAVSLSAAPEPLLSLTIVPGSITVGNLQDTGQFLAIGTYSTAPYTRDLTNSPNLTWISDVPSVFPVNTNSGGNAGATAGIVSAYGNGSANIIAEATNPSDGTIQTATATFNCPLVLPNPNGNPPTPGSCYPGSQAAALLATITLYNEGLNTTNWLVTAPSATGTANVIHCGPGWAQGGNSGGSVCAATYPISAGNIPILLTAPAQAGVAFGGWSYNCTPSDKNGVPLNPIVLSANGPNYCMVTITSSGNFPNTNVTVGAIFN